MGEKTGADGLASRGLVALRRRRGVSLKHCALMHEAVEEPLHLEIGRLTRAERRRRSLRRGIARWHLSTSVSTRARVKVLLLALTFTECDPMAARGAIRQFWTEYRNAFGKRPYFSWAELQMRGAVHYHAILVNPPWTMQRQARRWVGAHWKHADIQPSVQFRDDAWFREKSGHYVRKYASSKWDRGDSNLKSGPIPVVDKSYQQEYELLPREIRTWESNRLEHRGSAIEAHLDKPDIVWLRPMAPWPERMLHVWLIGRWKHWTPTWRACTLAQRKAPLRISEPGAAPFQEDYGGQNTAGSATD